MADAEFGQKINFGRPITFLDLECTIIILCQSGAGVEVLENKHYMAARFWNRHHFNHLCHGNPVILFKLVICHCHLLWLFVVKYWITGLICPKIRVFLPWEFINQTRGLFGNWSFDTLDEFTLPNGDYVLHDFCNRFHLSVRSSYCLLEALKPRRSQNALEVILSTIWTTFQATTRVSRSTRKTQTTTGRIWTKTLRLNVSVKKLICKHVDKNSPFQHQN